MPIVTVSRFVEVCTTSILTEADRGIYRKIRAARDVNEVGNGATPPAGFDRPRGFRIPGRAVVHSMDHRIRKPYAALFLPLVRFFIFQCAKGYLCPQFGHSQEPWRASASELWNMLTTRWHCRHIVGWLSIRLLSITLAISLKPSVNAGQIPISRSIPGVRVLDG